MSLPKKLYTCIFFNNDLNLFVCYYNLGIMTCIKTKSLEECLEYIKKDIKKYNIYNNKNLKSKDIHLMYMSKIISKKKWKIKDCGNLDDLYQLIF